MKRLCILAIGALLAQPAAADMPRVVRHLDGYACLRLALPEAQLRSFTSLPPVFAAPYPSAPTIGLVSATVIVAAPLEVQNGFAKVLHLDGRTGWVELAKLGPWIDATHPRTQCIPSMMSNGRPGFDYAAPK